MASKDTAVKEEQNEESVQMLQDVHTKHSTGSNLRMVSEDICLLLIEF